MGSVAVGFSHGHGPGHGSTPFAMHGVWHVVERLADNLVHQQLTTFASLPQNNKKKRGDGCHGLSRFYMRIVSHVFCVAVQLCIPMGPFFGVFCHVGCSAGNSLGVNEPWTLSLGGAALTQVERGPDAPCLGLMHATQNSQTRSTPLVHYSVL